jgi:hypothetical protein
MGKKTLTVRFSDLSGREFDGDDQPVRMVVLEHPALESGPVELEALVPEVTPALDAALNVAIVELHMPGEEVPRRLVVEADSFDALASDAPMVTLLKNAPTVKPGKRTDKTAINYATVEHAGTPHRGKVTAEEASIVRQRLADVNARLAAVGVRQIDPTNPEHASRYGFTA